MSSVIAEYLKVLGERDVHNLRMLLNEVLLVVVRLSVHVHFNLGLSPRDS